MLPSNHTYLRPFIELNSRYDGRDIVAVAAIFNLMSKKLDLLWHHRNSRNPRDSEMTTLLLLRIP